MIFLVKNTKYFNTHTHREENVLKNFMKQWKTFSILHKKISKIIFFGLKILSILTFINVKWECLKETDSGLKWWINRYPNDIY